MSTPRQPRWERQTPAERREAILEAAAAQFASRPYAQVKTSDIAAAAGVNRGLIHHYVGTKRELYLEVLRDALQVPVFPPLVALDPGSDLRAVLSADVDRWLDDVEGDRDAWIAAQRASSSVGLDPEVDELIARAREEAIDKALAIMFADVSQAPAALRGMLTCVAALAIQALSEWLELERLTRRQVHALLLTVALSVWENVDALLGDEATEISG